MAKLFSGIFLMIGGLIAFYIVQAFVGELNTSKWTANEVTLVTIILPAVVILASLLAVYVGVKNRIGRKKFFDE